MNITLDKVANTKAFIKIDLEKSDYQPTVDSTLKDYRKKVQLKGFRPGKVPTGLVKKMYGKSVLVEEVNRLVSSSLMNYIRDNQLNIVGDPVPDTEQDAAIDWDNPDTLKFSFEVGLASDFEVNAEELSLTKYKITYNDEYFQKIVHNYLDNYGTQEDPDTIQSEKDEVTAILQPVGFEFTKKSEEEEESDTEDSFPTSIIFTLKDVKEEALEKVKALKKEEMTVLPIHEIFFEKLHKFMPLFEREAADALEGDFEITIESISHKKPAEMNEEFFKKVLPPSEEVPTEEDFYAFVRKQIEEYHEQESERKAFIDVQKAIIEQVNVELPDEFLKDWLVKINEGKFERSQIEEEYESFAESLRWDLITAKVAQQEEKKLNTEDSENQKPWIGYEEIKEAAYAAVLGQFGMPINAISEEMKPQFEKIVNEYLMQENGKNYQQLYNEVGGKKVSELMLKSASTVEQEIDIEDFYKNI